MLHVGACVSVGGMLWDALKSMDRSCAGVALVTDEGGRLVGTLTDGDVRRALLGGAEVNDPLRPFIFRNYVAVGAGVGRAEVLDLMQARRIDQVPVLDEDGRLIGLHLLQEMLGPVERPNWAVVMAGGIGSRLRPLTDGIPKPMIRVAGRPILERIVLHLVGHGIRRVFLSVGYKAHVIEEHFGDGSKFGCRIEYLREESPLGTGGALSLLPEKPTAPVLVLNGDLVTQADVGAMLDAHKNRAVTLGVRRYVHTVPYGCVETDSAGRVEWIQEKPDVSVMVNAGVYIVEPYVIASIPSGPYSMPDLIDGWQTVAHEIEDDWLDVGQHDQLRLARGAA
jgi:dTDP-glucose pyrophosphorylase